MSIEPHGMPTNALALFEGATDALDRLQRWVEGAEAASRLVARLVNTPFVPTHYQVRVDPRAPQDVKDAALEQCVANGTAAVLYGVTLNIDPLMALQQIYVVNGRPGLYAKMAVALVQSRGHEVWTEERTATRAVVCGHRHGSSAPDARVVITMDMAKRAGWTRNAKYQETPEDMLWARAASRVCDQIASDVLKGIAMVELLDDDEPVQAEATAGRKRRVDPPARRALAAGNGSEAYEEPPIEPAAAGGPQIAAAEVPVVVEDVDQGDAKKAPAQPQGINLVQSRKLHAMLGAAGLGNRDLGLQWLSENIGREIETTGMLTQDELQVAFDKLEPLQPANGVPAAEAAEPPLE